MKLRTILEGCGAGILVILPYAWPQLAPNHVILYHSLLPSHAAAWGALIDLVSVSAAATLLFAYLEKRKTGARGAVWSLIAAKFAAVLLYVFLISGMPVPAAAAAKYLKVETVFAAILLAGLIVYRFRPAAYRSGVEGLRFLLLLVGFSAIWMIPELLYLGLVPQPIESVSFARAEPEAARPAGAKDPPGNGRRIVWLLFDELSYDQAFDHPYPGVALPEFDRFERKSVSFEALRPAGYYTEQVVPSFFLGDVIEGLKSDLHGRAEVKTSGQKGWRSFDGQRTLFMDAQQDGWTTGVAGWFNPYCRILAGSLDSCFWRPAAGQFGRSVLDDSVWESALMPIRSMFPQPGGSPYRREQEDDFTALMQRAQTLIKNENIRFVFIHLPIPHPPGIYDRETGRMRAGGTYIDNLVLADRTLGELMSTLNMTASASETTVVICSDHSWRVPMWRAKPGWTKEEETASGGRFDTRPVLMIHFPGQSNEVPIRQPFDEIRLHDILLQMLQGTLNSPAELASWMHGSPTRQQNLNLASGLVTSNLSPRRRHAKEN